MISRFSKTTLIASCVTALAAAPATEPASRPATSPASQPTQWETFTDAQRHFHFQYPSSWKAKAELVQVKHYTTVFAALNSVGKAGFTIRDAIVAAPPVSAEYGPRSVLAQLTAGAAYIDVSWFEGPLPRYGPGIHEIDAGDLSKPIKEATETTSGALSTRVLRFSKWGREWNVTVFFYAPVTQALRDETDKILASFRFDGVPSGDAVWAIGRAIKRLPPAADPEKFIREGGSSEYYAAAKVEGDTVQITFTKHLAGVAPESWTYRVTATGDVIDVTSRPRQ